MQHGSSPAGRSFFYGPSRFLGRASGGRRAFGSSFRGAVFGGAEGPFGGGTAVGASRARVSFLHSGAKGKGLPCEGRLAAGPGLAQPTGTGPSRTLRRLRPFSGRICLRRTPERERSGKTMPRKPGLPVSCFFRGEVKPLLEIGIWRSFLNDGSDREDPCRAWQKNRASTGAHSSGTRSHGPPEGSSEREPSARGFFSDAWGATGRFRMAGRAFRKPVRDGEISRQAVLCRVLLRRAPSFGMKQPDRSAPSCSSSHFLIWSPPA